MYSKSTPDVLKSYDGCGKYAVYSASRCEYHVLPCNSWKCPHCSKKKLRDLRHRFHNSSAQSWKNFSHVSLIVSDEYNSDIISSLLNDFITNLRKKFGHFEYVWVKEFQLKRMEKYEGVWRHVHLLISIRLNTSDIIPFWNMATGARFNIVQVTHPHDFGRGSYLLKYFTKSEFQNFYYDGERRYSSSKDVIPLVAKKQDFFDDWVFMRVSDARNLLFSASHLPRMRAKTEYEKLCAGYTIDEIPISDLNSLF